MDFERRPRGPTIRPKTLASGLPSSGVRLKPPIGDFTPLELGKLEARHLQGEKVGEVGLG